MPATPTLPRLPHRPVRAPLVGLVAAALVSGPALAQEPTLPVFEDGQAQVVEGFADRSSWIRQELWVETEFDSDGDGELDRVYVDVTRPAQTETEALRVPVIYESSPYYMGIGSTDSRYFWDPKHALGEEPPERGAMPAVAHQANGAIAPSHVSDWVPRGFAVVHSCSPGTGRSDGCPTVGGLNESLAPKAVIDWLCGRAKGYTTIDGDEEVEAYWSTGKVGMTGTSYNGTLPLAAASTGVEGLEAIIPVAANTSYYHYYRSNGLVRHPGGYMGEDIDVLYDFINSGAPGTRDYCNDEVRDKLLVERLDRVTGDLNDFWKGRDYLNALDPLRCAVLVAHAWNDWNVMPEHGVRLYEAVKAKGLPSQLFFHQGGHGGPPPMEMMNRWFTRYLYGVENGVEEDPRSWIVREGGRRNQPTSYPDYPHPEAEGVTLYPAKPGAVTGILGPKPGAEQGTESLVDDASEDGEALATASRSRHRLLYVTPELKQDVHISGTPRLTIRLSSSAPAANLSVWLVALPWEGRRIYNDVITRGWADPQNHRSETESEPLEPGEFYELTFDLQPDDHVVPTGQRIGLMIFSSDREFTLWPPAGTKLTVDLDATSLELPVVGGEAAFLGATSD